ncbi:HD4 [Enterospora canceri]|uniref:HD4 n=1 Tax=Enterospora canceri TaxID=1081671 RepID=A0A1Y1S6I5_9MICR|nr:HD4 [Enterospora canceri]
MQNIEIEAYLGLLKLKRETVIMAYSENCYINKTELQRLLLNSVFRLIKYPGRNTRYNLSILLNLSLRRVQVYFQNLRMNLKKTTRGSRRLLENKKPVEMEIGILFSIFLATLTNRKIDFDRLSEKMEQSNL